jgi:hypothetical protein
LPIGDIRLVVDDGSPSSNNYISILEKSGYQLYIENAKIDTSGLEDVDKLKTIY